MYDPLNEQIYLRPVVKSNMPSNINAPTITDKECSLINRALVMYANWIETRDVLSSSEDLIIQDRREELQSLSIEQMKLIITLRKLAITYATTN